MDPIIASKALRLIAQNIDLNQSPSISDVTADLEQLLRFLEPKNSYDRIASDRVAGPVDWVKGLKRKVFDSKGSRKILEKLDNLKSMMKLCGVIAKKVRKGEDMADLAAEDEYLQVFEGAADYMLMAGGSDELNSIAESEEDMASALADLDDHWLDNEDDEDKDREVIVNALSEFHAKCKEDIQKAERRLKKQKSRQKDGKKLPPPKSKKKPKAPEEETD